MIPSNTLSAFPKPGGFLPPDDKRPRIKRKSSDISSYGQCLDANPTDWEIGGLGLNDTSRGSNYQTWVFTLSGTDIITYPVLGGSVSTVLSGLSGVSEVVGAFDGNMQPVVAYVQNGTTKLYWYSSEDEGFVITSFPGCDSPRLTLDDKRSFQSASADVLFFYIKAGALYYRQQRDAYSVERFLQDCPPNTLRLGRVGMGTTNRVQIEFLTVG